MRQIYSLFVVLSSLLLISTSTNANPSAPPPNGYTGGIFAQYFRNIVEFNSGSGLCPVGQGIIGYNGTPGVTYGTPICSNMSIASGSQGQTLTFSGGVWTPTNLLSHSGTSIGIGTLFPDARLTVNGSIRYTQSLFRSESTVTQYDNVLSWGINSSNQTGALKIVLPKTWSNTMLQIKILGYDYGPNGAWSATVAGYNHTTTPAWINHSAYIEGRAPFTQVRLAHDGTRNVILLGNTGTIWQYPQVTVKEVSAGYANQSGWETGWSAGLITNEVGITNIATPAIPTFISSANNVGIGTVTPGQRLDVSGGSIRTTNQLISTLATGTAPLAVTSTTRVANLNVATAGTADQLTTARTIGGVSFDGTANINLPGVNTAGNQNTTGNAATATALQNARTIAGVSFNGTANIDIPFANLTARPTTLAGYGITDAQPFIATGTALQYYRGDKTWQTLNTTAVTEGTNLYWTAARFDTAFSGKTTSNLAEGTNQYFTNARAQAAITGGASTIATANLTASRALVSDGSGKVGVSAVTSTELGYVSGVTGAIQTQLDGKAPLASPALTGTPTAPTASSGTNNTQIATTAFVNTEISKYTPLQSARDFATGTLIATDIDYSLTSGDPWLLEIEGNSYGGLVPFDIKYQGYIYSDTVINHGGISNGSNITGLVLFNYNGKLHFWFPRQSYWQGFTATVNSSLAGVKKNRVISITSTDKPAGVTKEVALSANIRQSLHSGNFNSYAPSLTGVGASGTWGINITGNAATATTATTSLRNTIEDTRAAQRTPDGYDDYRASYEFTNQITGLPGWQSAMTLQGWANGYAAWQIIGPATISADENWYLRSGINAAWNPIRTIAHSGNIGSLETDPQVGANTTNYVSKWNGSALVTSGIFDNGTNVGIGTNSPDPNLLLQIASSSIGLGARAGVTNSNKSNFTYLWSGFSGATNDSALVWNSVGNIRFGTETSPGIGFSEKVRITTTGNVGIGTVAPTQLLTVAGARGLPATTGTTQNGMLRVTPSASDGGTITLDMGVGTSGVNNGWLQVSDRTALGTNYSLALNPNGGNVGIGTSNPTSQTEIQRIETTNRTSYNDVLSVTANATTLPYSGHGGGILFRGTTYRSGVGNVNYARIGSTINDHSSSTDGSDLFFDVSPLDDGVLSRAMTIKFNGNVGIGTVTPGQRLDVSGGSIRTTNQLISTLATGTAPLAVTSTTRVANLNVATAGTADQLTTARTIGGVSFDGTANINLPGVNTAGNQNTTGNAATATALQTARTINGVSFNGTANVTLPTVNTTGDQTISGVKTFTDLRIADGTSRSNLDPSLDVAAVMGGSSILGDGIQQDLLAFNPPTSQEYWNGTAWIAEPVTTTLFQGKLGQNWGGYNLSPTNTRVRFTWNSFGYRFWHALGTANSTNGNIARYIIESSPDGVAWTIEGTSGWMGSWPGYHTFNNIANSYGTAPFLRITIERDNINSNNVTIGQLSLIGSYGGFSRLFDWDANRNVFFQNNVGIGTVTPGQRLDVSGGSIRTTNQLISTLATGTAPLAVTSTTRVANLNVATAGTADQLTTARTIGGVSFDGTANINLPGVNTAGNQNTTGNAATATALQNARTIAGVSFNGTANIDIPFANLTARPTTVGGYGITDAVNTTGDQTIGGNKTFTGDVIVQGKVVTDTLVNRTVQNLTISGSLYPYSTSSSKDLGATGNRWNNGFFGGNIAAGGWVGAGCEGECEGGGGYSLMYPNGTIVATTSVTAPSFIGNATTATTASAVPWSGVTSKPTTLAGYGITDFISSNASNPVAADAVTTNGNYYVNANIGLFGQTDGALYSQAYGPSWVGQIYQDYRTGQIALRGKNNGVWQAWRTNLDSGNYTSYAPSLTGGGASGTWGINVTGNAATASNATQLGNITATNYIALRTYTTSGALDTITDQALRLVSYPGHSRTILTLNAGGSPGTIQQEFHYNPAVNGWRIRGHQDSTTWNPWSFVVMSANNQGNISGTIFHTANDGSGSSLDADLLDGQQGSYYAPINSPNLTGTPTAPTAASGTNSTQIATTAFVNTEISKYTPYQSARDFATGTLIATDIDYSLTEGEPWLLEIEGNSYGSDIPFDIKYQGYIYSDTVINHGGISNGTYLTGMVLFNYNGKLHFWFPRQGYWQGFTVAVNSSYAGFKKNRLVSITSQDKPGGITKEVSLSPNIHQSLTSGNYTSYTPNLTGSGASGTWGINITGNATTATTSLRNTIEDTRAAQRTPDGYDDYRASYEFTNQITGLPGWQSAMTLQGWHNGYAAWQIIGPATYSADENWYLRSGINAAWNPIRTIAHSGNIGSLETDPQVGANTTNYVSKWNGSALVTSGIFDNGTNVGIGTATPGAKLDIKGAPVDSLVLDADSGFQGRWVRFPGRVTAGSAGDGYPSIGYNFYPTSTGTYVKIANDTAYGIHLGNSNRITFSYAPTGTGTIAWNDAMVINNAGNVGIGTVTPGQKLEVAGNILATSYLTASDKNLKQDIRTLTGALDRILALRGYSFTWKSDGRRDVGIIAQDVERQFPELVHTNLQGIKSVEYANLIAPVIEAIHEQQSIINQQKVQIDELNSRLKKMESLIESIDSSR